MNQMSELGAEHDGEHKTNKSRLIVTRRIESRPVFERSGNATEQSPNLVVERSTTEPQFTASPPHARCVTAIRFRVPELHSLDRLVKRSNADDSVWSPPSTQWIPAMPKQSIVALAIMAIGTASIALGDRGYNSEPIGGPIQTVEITDKMLKKTPAWPKDAENPPLSARRALKLAEDYVDTNYRRDKEWIRELDSIALVPSDGKWFWKAEFLWSPRNGNLGGGQPNCVVAILMDGTVVRHKKLEDGPAQNFFPASPNDGQSAK